MTIQEAIDVLQEILEDTGDLELEDERGYSVDYVYVKHGATKRCVIEHDWEETK